MKLDRVEIHVPSYGEISKFAKAGMIFVFVRAQTKSVHHIQCLFVVFTFMTLKVGQPRPEQNHYMYISLSISRGIICKNILLKYFLASIYIIFFPLEFKYLFIFDKIQYVLLVCKI